jgi:SpoVK/Ycf46/Vps4 family AAA+-type ATPase
MATADQLKALIRSHYESEPERFNTIALQIAAHEARLGHASMAEEVRRLVDKAKVNKPKLKPLNPELWDLVLEVETGARLNELVAAPPVVERIKRIIHEYAQRDKLRRFDHENRRKILLTGPPGTGKTMTASIIAHEVGLPLKVVMIDRMITKFMGETSAKLRQIFELIREVPGVYLFDEFDAIGTQRGNDNEVGEMRRVVNAFLQFIEHDKSDSLIVAASNALESLDTALFRRFDDVILYHLPTEQEKLELLENRLTGFSAGLDLRIYLNKIGTLSHAEVLKACNDAIKDCILNDRRVVDEDLLGRMIEERKNAYI